MKTVELRPISKFTEGVNGSICISPRFWGWGLVQGREATQLIKEARKKAKGIEDICIAIIHDDKYGIDYVLGEHVGRMFTKFLLFNAKEVEDNRKEGTITTFMKKDLPGGKNFVIIEKYLQYENGAIY